MLVFPSASRALRGAMEIQRSFQQPHNGESVRVRIGLHTGEVLRKADDFFGHAVIMAARVAAQAQGNGDPRVVAREGADSQHRLVQFGEPRTAELKGLPGRHQLFPLVWRNGRSKGR